MVCKCAEERQARKSLISRRIEIQYQTYGMYADQPVKWAMNGGCIDIKRQNRSVKRRRMIWVTIITWTSSMWRSAKNQWGWRWGWRWDKRPWLRTIMKTFDTAPVDSQPSALDSIETGLKMCRLLYGRGLVKHWQRWQAAQAEEMLEAKDGAGGLRWAMALQANCALFLAGHAAELQ
jgi:hypothetical protein